MADPAFWREQAKAAKISQELAVLKEEKEKWEKIGQNLTIFKERAAKIDELAETEAAKNLEKEIDLLEKEISREELKIFFSGPYDKNDVLLSVYSGAGGTEAQDWAQILLRMYQRFADKRNFKTKVLHIHEGQEAGIKSAVIEISGAYAFGTFKGESGVHRLVRLSPFNAANLRHTSFALVEILPELEDVSQAAIKPEDVEIETFKSSGPGGQYVNKTESAVRLTHKPTGLVAACQSERSQAANREQAMKVLASQLFKRQQKEQTQAVEKIRSNIQSGEGTAEWGSQIRNYVLHPYKLVKDLRTGVESNQPDRVLDGELDEFIDAEIKKQGA
jgi:peptide chain release factor 2